MSLRQLFPVIAAALAAATLGACSGASAATSNPIPTFPPILSICKGAVLGGNGASVPIKIGTLTAGALLLVPDHTGNLSVTPRIIELSAAHPSAKMTIEQPGYRGPFAVLFNGPGACNAFNLTFKPQRLRGPKVTATFSLTPAK